MSFHETILFRDRIEAGELLAEKLKHYKNDPGIILAVPRGGVPIAYPVAVKLGFPLEVILTKKISHPLYKEYAIGAAGLTDYFVLPHHNVTDDYIQQELKRIRTRLKDMQKMFMEGDEQQDLEGKTVIVIDDGIATGHTILATIHILRQKHPAKIIVAVPVASQNAVESLSREVDEMVVLKVPPHFHGVGAYYEDFEQVSDAEVIHYLEELRVLRKAG